MAGFAPAPKKDIDALKSFLHLGDRLGSPGEELVVSIAKLEQLKRENCEDPILVECFDSWLKKNQDGMKRLSAEQHGEVCRYLSSLLDAPSLVDRSGKIFEAIGTFPFLPEKSWNTALLREKINAEVAQCIRSSSKTFYGDNIQRTASLIWASLRHYGASEEWSVDNSPEALSVFENVVCALQDGVHNEPLRILMASGLYFVMSYRIRNAEMFDGDSLKNDAESVLNLPISLHSGMSKDEIDYRNMLSLIQDTIAFHLDSPELRIPQTKDHVLSAYMISKISCSDPPFYSDLIREYPIEFPGIAA